MKNDDIIENVLQCGKEGVKQNIMEVLDEFCDEYADEMYRAVEEIIRLRDENAALRERLEKTVELPVKLYSKVWDKNRKEFEIIGIELHGANYYINCANKATGEIASFDGEDIGDEWFTTEELCDLHRRAFGLDKSKIESDEASIAEIKGEKK